MPMESQLADAVDSLRIREPDGLPGEGVDGAIDSFENLNKAQMKQVGSETDDAILTSHKTPAKSELTEENLSEQSLGDSTSNQSTQKNSHINEREIDFFSSSSSSLEDRIAQSRSSSSLGQIPKLSEEHNEDLTNVPQESTGLSEVSRLKGAKETSNSGTPHSRRVLSSGSPGPNDLGNHSLGSLIMGNRFSPNSLNSRPSRESSRQSSRRSSLHSSQHSIKASKSHSRHSRESSHDLPNPDAPKNNRHLDYISPLDDIDLFLPNAKPSSQLSQSQRDGSDSRDTSLSRSPQNNKQGLLSFNNEDNDSIDDGSEEIEDEDLSVGKAADKSLNFVRRNQTRTRKLETENMELRLKLQQYREMNAGEQEISRAKHQLYRSERRIDELEKALERKNQTIRELCEQRDAAVQNDQSEKNQELYTIIEELQTAITQLEEDNNETKNNAEKAIAQSHKDFPDIVPENAGVNELIAAIKQLFDENSQLTSLASSSSALRAQQNAIKDLLTKAGHPGDPLFSVRELIADLAQATQDSSSMRESLGQENRKLTQETQSLHEMYSLRLQDAIDLNNKLKARVDADEVLRHDLEVKLSDFERLLKESRAAKYSIIQNIFAELFEVLGADYQEAVELELESIVEHARNNGLSKVPLLIDLLIKHIRQLGEAALRHRPNQDRKIWALEHEIQALEKIVELKMDRAGADLTLRAQVRDLRRELKMAEEKRKSEWMDYERSLQQMRRSG